MSPDSVSLEAACAAGARVIVVVHFYGFPVDWDAVTACAERHHALLVEDAAQGQGASWRRRPLGSLAPLSILSFGRGKGWTGGAGGALLLRGEATEWPLSTSVAAPAALRAHSLFLSAGAQWVLA